LLAGVIFLPAGCSKEAPAVTAAAAAEGAGSEPEIPAAAPSAYPLRTGMWLYTIDDDTGAAADLTRAVEALPLGEELQLVTAEKRRATNPYDKTIYDYFQVRRDTGREGLVFANQLTVDSVPAVVSDEKANLYRSPKNVDATDYILSRRTVLGAFPGTERDGFIRIDAYDPADQAYRKDLFIKTSALSYREEDVQSSILLQTAEALDPEKERNRRSALLDSALYDYPQSIFAADIRALAGIESPVPVQEAGEADGGFLAAAQFLRVTGDRVTVHEGPSVSAWIIAQLPESTRIFAVERTAEPATVEDRTAPWYHITEPVEGWVFGWEIEREEP
jgi:hypothetical protein